MNWLVKLLHLKGLRRKYVFYCVNKRYAGTKEKHFAKKRKLLNSLDGIQIGEGSRIVGPVTIYGKLTVGRDCWIGKDFSVNGNGSVVIGDRCDIGPEVSFLTGSHEIGGRERRAGKGISFTQTVGSGTWIGSRTTIANGVQIGEGCILAACTCLTRSIPDDTLVGGVPGKMIRSLKDED